MYAVVEIAGQQFKVEKDQHIFAHRLDVKEGDEINFDKVFLVDNAGKVNIGTPTLDKAVITAKVIEHLKGDKVIVFKKKRRKGYKVKNGHRQYLTKLQILTISEDGSLIKNKKQSKAEATKKPATKKPATKKPATKKPAAKKPAAKK